jgi:hypothetical protein
MLFFQFQRGLKEVDVEPQCAIQLDQLAIGRFSFVAVVADKLPDHRAIFLLDKALVILFIGAPARE